jgi:hypothetical protein
MRTLFWIASTNFVFPGKWCRPHDCRSAHLASPSPSVILNIVQTVLLLCHSGTYTYLQPVNTFVCTLSAVFASGLCPVSLLFV